MRFFYQCHLQRHFKSVHQKIKVDCKVCGKDFRDKSSLKHHTMVVHEKSLSLQCQLCNKVFSQRNTLKLHTKQVHYGLKNNECHICKKFYGLNLSTHIKNVHGDYTPHKCPHCSMKFKYQSTFETHIKTKH